MPIFDAVGNLQTTLGCATLTLAAWTPANWTGGFTAPLGLNSGCQSIVVQLDQNASITAGAVTWQGSYNGVDWVTIPAQQVLDPTNITFQQIPNPYTFSVSSALNKAFLILMGGYQSIRALESTPMTGSGASITPYFTQLSYSPVTVAAQSDSTGSLYVNEEGRKATYSASSVFTPVAGDIAVLPGSATKTIRVLRVEVSISTSGSAAYNTVQLIKRSAADTSGTSAAMTTVPHDSNFAAASAAPLRYTAAPTPGAAVGAIRGAQIYNPGGASALSPNITVWTFGTEPGGSAVVLRGTAQQLCVNLGAVIATQTASVTFAWTEE